MTEVIICNDACSSLAVVHMLELPRSIAQENQSLDCASTETDAVTFVNVRLLCSVYYFGREAGTSFADLSTDLLQLMAA
jgi:hypothetical protein